MYTFRIADSSAADMTQWHQLRTAVYLTEGYITGKDLGDDGLFRDSYDDYSIHVLACDTSGTPVGCVRMIAGQVGKLQVAHEFSVRIVDDDAFEVSGCVVVAEHRKSYVTLGLYRALFELAGDLGYRRAYMVVEQDFLTALVELGLPVSTASEPRHIFNTSNVAAVLVVDEIVKSLSAADARRGNATKFAPFFAQRFKWTMTVSDVIDESADAQGARSGS